MNTNIDNRLIEAEDLLISLYADMQINHASPKQRKRMDTILSKINLLKEMMMNETE